MTEPEGLAATKPLWGFDHGSWRRLRKDRDFGGAESWHSTASLERGCAFESIPNLPAVDSGFALHAEMPA